MSNIQRFFEGLVLIWLLVNHRLPAVEFEILSPLDYQVIQRAALDRGTLRIVGRLSEVATHEAFVEVRLWNEGQAGAWRRIDSTILGRDVLAQLDVQAGGWKRLEVRVATENNVLAQASVGHVGVGEVFVIAGQSNSANHGEKKQSPKSDRVVAWDGTKWQLANDPQPGASGTSGSFIPAFGDALVERLNVPVGIVACGMGATSVREWLPEGSAFSNPPTLVRRRLAIIFVKMYLSESTTNVSSD